MLAATGHLDTAYRLLFQKTWPSWLYAVTQGATTIWERWDGWTHDKGFQNPGMNSFNHYAYGAIGAWLYAVRRRHRDRPGEARLQARDHPPAARAGRHARASRGQGQREVDVRHGLGRLEEGSAQGDAGGDDPAEHIGDGLRAGQGRARWKSGQERIASNQRLVLKPCVDPDHSVLAAASWRC